jgi:hypothetical protein
MASRNCTIALFKRKMVLGYPLARIQWVAVLVDPGKQLKPASSLAKALGFKDMHTAGDKGIMTVLNKPFKAEGPFFLSFAFIHS